MTRPAAAAGGGFHCLKPSSFAVCSFLLFLEQSHISLRTPRVLGRLKICVRTRAAAQITVTSQFLKHFAPCYPKLIWHRELFSCLPLPAEWEWCSGAGERCTLCMWAAPSSCPLGDRSHFSPGFPSFISQEYVF